MSGIPIALLDAVYKEAAAHDLEVVKTEICANADGYRIVLGLPFMYPVVFDYDLPLTDQGLLLVRAEIARGADDLKRYVYRKCASYIDGREKAAHK